MKIIKNPGKNGAGKIEIAELKEMSKKMLNNLVKAVVDIELKIMAVDAEMHVDLEQILIEEENCQNQNLWGINIYPANNGDDRIEFDSMINLKPAWGNRTRGVESEEIRKKIIEVVNNLIK